MDWAILVAFIRRVVTHESFLQYKLELNYTGIDLTRSRVIAFSPGATAFLNLPGSRRKRVEPGLPREVLFLLLDPREEAAVEQAEEVDVEKLITDGDESEVGHLNDGP